MTDKPILDDFSPADLPDTAVDERMQRCRAESAVAYWPLFDAWMVTRYEDVLRVLHDPLTFSSAGVYQSVGWAQETRDRFAETGVNPIGEGFIITMDPPRHTVMRRQLNSVFTPRRVAEQEPAIRRIVTGQLNLFPVGEAFDIIECFAASLQILVLFKMLNIPEADLAQLRAWVVHLKRLSSVRLPVEEQLACADSAINLDRYVGDLIADRRKSPTDDFYSDLINRVPADGHEWSEGQLRSVISPGLILAGFTTTRNVLGFAIFNLLSHRAAWEQLVKAPRLIPAAIEESLRFSPPMFGFFRTTTRDVELHGVKIPAGAHVVWSAFSANRDERQFNCPSEFDIARPVGAAHVSFGHGTHFCLGAGLARLTIRVALEELVARFPRLELAPGFEPRCSQGPVARDFEELMVRIPLPEDGHEQI